jgi:hypothetical protein
LNAQSLRAVKPALLVLLSFGCSRAEKGDGFAHEAVSGTVTLNRQPLDSASIQFIPAAPGTLPETSADIKDGKFEIGSERGPVPGSYKVLISSQSAAEVRPGEMPGDPPKPRPDPIPAKYNTKSTLTAEVKAGGPNSFEFPLQTK